MDQDRVEGVAREFGGTVKRTAGEFTGDTKTQASGAIDEAVGSAQRVYGKFKDRVANGAGSAVVEQIDEAGAFIGDAVAERPLTSLLVAGAIGYVLAMLVRR